MKLMLKTLTDLDLSEVLEVFDLEENRRLLRSQLDALDTDACEGLIDNFKMLYKTYASVNENKNIDSDTKEEVHDAFTAICNVYIEEICAKFGLTVDEDYLESHEKSVPNVALALYLFFVLNFRSNLYDVLLRYISKNSSIIAENFDAMRQRHDAITMVNREMEDQDIALIASNIYDVVDWVVSQMNNDTYLENMDSAYTALGPTVQMFNDAVVNGDFVETIGDIIQSNIDMKGRVCFDIVCRLKGLTF